MLDQLAIWTANYLLFLIVGIAVVYILTRPRRERIHLAIFGGLVLLLVFLVSAFASALYKNPRPFVVGHFTPLIPHKPGNGFPSGHMLWSAGIAAFIFPSNRYLSAVLWMLSIAVGAARVYVGVHHPIDIIGSVVIVVVVSALVDFALRRLNVLDRLKKSRRKPA